MSEVKNGERDAQISKAESDNANGNKENQGTKRDVKFSAEQQEQIDAMIAEATKKANAEAMELRHKSKQRDVDEKAKRDAELKESQQFKTLYDETQVAYTNLQNENAALKHELQELRALQQRVQEEEDKERKQILSVFSESDKVMMKDLSIAQLRYLAKRVPSTSSDDTRNGTKADSNEPLRQRLPFETSGGQSKILDILSRVK